MVNKTNLDKIYLGSIGVMLLALFMPWIDFKIMSFNALNHGLGIVALLIIIAIGVLYVYNKKASIISHFVFSAIFIALIIYKISTVGLIIDLGFFGEVSIFSFLGVGLYVFIVAMISAIVVGIKRL